MPPSGSSASASSRPENGHLFEDLRYGGGGDRDGSVGTLNFPGAQREWRAHQHLCSYVLQGCANTNDVDQGIVVPGFVQVGIGELAAVHPRFGFGEHTRVLQSLSYAFDFGVFEILTTLLFGGTLFLQGDAVRVSGKSRDELQAVISHLKGLDYPVELQFENYR